MKQETDDINNFASKREVEELYRAFKDDSSTFKESKSRNKCDPAKLRLYFEKHFSSDAEQPTSHELTDAPNFIKKLHDITLYDVDTGPPDLQIVQIF